MMQRGNRTIRWLFRTFCLGGMVVVGLIAVVSATFAMEADSAENASVTGVAPVEAPRPEDLLTVETPEPVDVEPLHPEIDRLIAAGFPDDPSLIAPLADDAEFLRRVFLDLTGVLPTIEQAREFLESDDSEKRARLVDELLESPEHARHMQRKFDVMLMRRLPARNVPADQWQTFLRTSFAENRPWDEVVRDILSADGVDPEDRGPARFYLDRDGDMHDLTRDIGRLFLGANLECAQCHDHPEVYDWSQEHYFGISAFLVRTFVFTDQKEKRTMLAEKADGEVTFESVFEIRDKTSEGPKSTLPKLFDSDVISEPEFEEGEEYEVKPDKDVRPIPKFSRRAHLPDAITSPENRRFARTTANRVWEMMLGRGLVHPVDMDHSLNPPSHPELLDLLTDRLIEQKFNLRWLMREIVLSETYQRSSRIPNEDHLESLDDSRFTHALLKPLSPAQFAWAILQATGEADVHRAALGENLSEEALHKRLLGHENNFVRLFGGVPGSPPEHFEATVDQALFLSNDGAIQGLIRRKNGNMTDRLLKLPADDHGAIAEELFLGVLTRFPSDDDVDDVRNFLADREEADRPAAMEELIWALLTSSEFRFNH